MTITRLRWGLLLLCIAAGLSMLNWAIANTSFSVPADSAMSEIYKTRAMLGLYLAIACFGSGAACFVGLRKRVLESARKQR